MREIAEVIVTALGPDFESAKEDLAARTGALMDRFPLYAELAASRLTPLRVWVDMSAPAHVLVLRPIIERLRARRPRGRDHLARLRPDPGSCSSCTGCEHTPIGRHGGASRLRKAYRPRRPQQRRCCASAAAAASTSPSPTAPTTWRSPPRALGVPEANMHDYEYAVTQHRIGCRLAGG